MSLAIDRYLEADQVFQAIAERTWPGHPAANQAYLRRELAAIYLKLDATSSPEIREVLRAKARRIKAELRQPIR